MAGTSFPYIEFLPKPGQAKIIQIDIDPTRIGLRADVDVGLVGDCRGTLDLLLKFCPQEQDGAFLGKCQRRMSWWNQLMEERGTRSDKPMKPQVVTHALNKLLNDDAIVISDSALAAGLNRALLVSKTTAGPVVEWQDLRTRLNTLAARFGYPEIVRG